MDRVWRDRLVYLAVWLACAAPIGWIVYLGLTDGLTANPIEKVIRTLGDMGLYILIVSLAVTPAARILRQPRLIRFRRTIGLWGFTYVTLHLLTYVCIDQFFDWGAIGKDILKRPFITIGMTAFVLLVPLAVTSTNGMVRRLGPRAWKRLHQLIYVIVPLGVIHYFLMVKRDTRPVVVFGLFVALLLAWRLLNPGPAPQACAEEGEGVRLAGVEIPEPDLWKKRPFAPAPGERLGPLDEIPDGRAKEYAFGVGIAAFRMFVVRRGEGVYGYVNQCPHYSLPLNHRPDQFLTRAGDRIMCTQHLALFRIEDGACLDGACEGRSLDPVPVEVHDGQILIG